MTRVTTFLTDKKVKRANTGLGQYPDVSLLKAREKRDIARKLLADNIDPKDHRTEQEQQKRSYRENLRCCC